MPKSVNFLMENIFQEVFELVGGLHMGNQCRYRPTAQVPTSQNTASDEHT